MYGEGHVHVAARPFRAPHIETRRRVIFGRRGVGPGVVHGGGRLGADGVLVCGGGLNGMREGCAAILGRRMSVADGEDGGRASWGASGQGARSSFEFLDK